MGGEIQKGRHLCNNFCLGMLRRLKFHRLWIWYDLHFVVGSIFLSESCLCASWIYWSVGQITILSPLSAGVITMSLWFWSCWSASISFMDMLFVFGVYINW